MLRRLGCLAALVSLLVFLAVLAVVGWFGYAAYTHARDVQAVASRTQEVGTAWANDPAALAKAAGGTGGVRPAGLSTQPFQQLGARPTTGYTVSRATLTLRTSTVGCHPAPLTVDVVETPVLVQVLVRPENPWLPDVGRFWEQLHDSSGCTDKAAPATVTVTLGSGLGKRVLVDAVTGTSVRKR